MRETLKKKKKKEGKDKPRVKISSLVCFSVFVIFSHKQKKKKNPAANTVQLRLKQNKTNKISAFIYI